MRLTTRQATDVFRLLYDAKLKTLQDEEKYKVIRLIKELKPIATSFEEFHKDAINRLRPENIESVLAKIQGGEPLLQEEARVYNEYDKKVYDCILPELEKENEIKSEGLSEETIERLASCNDFKVSEILFLSETLEG